MDAAKELPALDLGGVVGPNAIERTVEIHVKGAMGLAAMDSNGCSDPYCVVKVWTAEEAVKPCGKHTTETIKKSLNPTWNERFKLTLPSNSPSPTLTIDVFDRDTIGSDKLGHIRPIDLNFTSSDEWNNLWVELVGGPFAKGALDFRYRFVPTEAPLINPNLKNNKNQKSGVIAVAPPAEDEPADSNSTAVRKGERERFGRVSFLSASSESFVNGGAGEPDDSSPASETNNESIEEVDDESCSTPRRNVMARNRSFWIKGAAVAESAALADRRSRRKRAYELLMQKLQDNEQMIFSARDQFEQV